MLFQRAGKTGGLMVRRQPGQFQSPYGLLPLARLKSLQEVKNQHNRLRAYSCWKAVQSTGSTALCTREIVGYAMAARMTKALVIQSLFRAVSAKRPEAGLVHHYDRGSQCCAHEFRRLLDWSLTAQNLFLCNFKQIRRLKSFLAPQIAL
jgi:transposase InsO family protein